MESPTSSTNEPGSAGISKAIDLNKVVNYKGLAELLLRTPDTLRVALATRPDTLPPPIYTPGTKSPLWITGDVIDWLRSYQVESGEKRSRKPRVCADEKAPRRGAPPMRERVDAQRLGISVKELRRRKKDSANRQPQAAAAA